jgi:hypothetical protein
MRERLQLDFPDIAFALDLVFDSVASALLSKSIPETVVNDVKDKGVDIHWILPQGGGRGVLVADVGGHMVLQLSPAVVIEPVGQTKAPEPHTLGFVELSARVERTRALQSYETSEEAKQLVLQCLYQAALRVASKEMVVLRHLARMYELLGTTPGDLAVPTGHLQNREAYNFWQALMEEDDVTYRALAMLASFGVTHQTWDSKQTEKDGFAMAEEKIPHSATYVFQWFHVDAVRTIYGKAA